MSGALHSSGDVSRLTGLSMERLSQYARSNGVQKLGNSYLWTDSDIEGLLSRKGRAGRPKGGGRARKSPDSED